MNKMQELALEAIEMKRAELDAVEREIRGMGETSAPVRQQVAVRRKRWTMTPEQRAAHSKRMKALWAAKRKVKKG